VTALALPLAPPLAVRGGPRGRHSYWRNVRFSRQTTIFLVCVALYLTIGAILVFGFSNIMEDALSRVANAQYVLDSRQPKLANVGFVWTPLPSLLMLPFLPLKALWPGLIATGFLACVESAVVMAASVVVLFNICTDLGLRRGGRWAIAMLFAVQPIGLFYGANGMSEALLILFTLIACLRLLRWLVAEEEDSSRHLVAAGLALGFGYLARYEVAAAGLGAMALVGAVTFYRNRVNCADRRARVVGDVLLIGLPVAVAFVLWAVASWVIVGHPAEQFTSHYGNSAIIAGAQGATRAAASAKPSLSLPILQILVLAPLSLPVGAVAIWRGVRERKLVFLAPLVLFGSVLVFEAAAYLRGSLFGFLRYQIAVVPLFAVLLAVALIPAAESSEEQHGRRSINGASPRIRVTLHRLRRPGSGALLAAALLIPGIVTTTYAGMTSYRLANQEFYHVRPVILRLAGGKTSDPGADGFFDVDGHVSGDLDRLRLPTGSVLLDAGPGFAVLAASHRPRQFVINSDHDFAGSLLDPVGHHIRYFLTSAGNSGYDAINTQWPRLGTAVTPRVQLIRNYSSSVPGGHRWALWQIVEQS
jgi:hypothetical protein